MDVLLVENECVIARSLRDAGHEVAVSSSPDEARALPGIASFDAIVLGGAGPDAASVSACAELAPGRDADADTPARGGAAKPRRGSEGSTPARTIASTTTCPFDELLARLRALARRAATSGGTRIGPDDRLAALGERDVGQRDWHPRILSGGALSPGRGGARLTERQSTWALPQRGLILQDNYSHPRGTGHRRSSRRGGLKV